MARLNERLKRLEKYLNDKQPVEDEQRLLSEYFGTVSTEHLKQLVNEFDALEAGKNIDTPAIEKHNEEYPKWLEQKHRIERKK